MTLTNKLYDFGKAAVIATAALTLLPNYSDAQLRKRQRIYSPQTIERTVEQTQSSQEQPQAQVKVPSYEEFRDVLVKKGKYDKEKENDLKAFWDKLKEKNRISEYFREIKPEDYIKAYNEKERKAFEDFKLDEDIIKSFSWKSSPDDLADRSRMFDFVNYFMLFKDYRLIPNF